MSNRLIKRAFMGSVAGLAGLGATSAMAQQQDGFSWYGSLNLGVLSVDDGTTTTTEFGDNSHAPSRVGFWYQTQAANGVLKFNFETSLGLAGSGSFSQGPNGDLWDWDRTNLRKVEVIYVTDNAGTFYAGQGSMASDGAAFADLSGTGVVAGAAIGDMAGSFQFRDTAGNLTGPTIGGVFNEFDGSRRARVRYDTPEFGGGFVASAAVGQDVLSSGVDDTFYDVGLYYDRTAGNMKYQGAIGGAYRDISGAGQDVKQGTASFSALHTPTGISGTMAVGSQNTTGNYVYAKVGLQRDWFSFGTTALSADVFLSQDMVSAGDDGTAYSLAVVQNLDAQAMQVYLGYKTHDYNDVSATTYQRVDAVQFGARWSF